VAPEAGMPKTINIIIDWKTSYLYYGVCSFKVSYPKFAAEMPPQSLKEILPVNAEIQVQNYFVSS